MLLFLRRYIDYFNAFKNYLKLSVHVLGITCTQYNEYRVQKVSQDVGEMLLNTRERNLEFEVI